MHTMAKCRWIQPWVSTSTSSFISMVQWRKRVGGNFVVVAAMAALALAGPSTPVIGPQVLTTSIAVNTTNATQTTPTTTTRSTTTHTPTTTTLLPTTAVPNTTTVQPTITTEQPSTVAPTTTPTTTTTLAPVTTTTNLPTTTVTVPPTTVPTTTTNAPTHVTVIVQIAASPSPPISTTDGSTESAASAMEVSTSGELSAPVVACIIVGGLILVCLAVIAVVSFQRLVSKKRRLDKQDNMAMRSNFDESQIDSSMLDHHSTADGPSRYYPPYSKHPPKSPVPVLSLRHYESDTASTVKTDLSIKTDSDTNFHMYGRPTSDSIDSYRPSPHGDVYRNMTSPSYTPHTRASHTFSDTLTASHRTNDFSFSTQFSRVSSMSTFRAYSSNLLLRNSDDLSVYSDRSDGTIF